MAGLDHIVHCTADFEALRTGMTQAGFTLTPPAEHPFGTGNSLVQLNGFFLEFLHLPNPHLVPVPDQGEFGFAGFNQEFMKDATEGCSMLVFEAKDAASEQDRFETAGLDTYNLSVFRGWPNSQTAKRSRSDFRLPLPLTRICRALPFSTVSNMRRSISGSRNINAMPTPP